MTDQQAAKAIAKRATAEARCIALESSAVLAESLALSLEAGNQLTPAFLRVMARSLRNEATR